MRLTVLGHASYLVEGQNTKILMDPVLGDTFEGGNSIPFPSRTINKKDLPQVDAIILSHFHSDHFDIDSLVFIGKAIPIYCPMSTHHILFLKQAGFKTIIPMKEFEVKKIGNIEIFPTPSNSPVHNELGVIFKEEDCVIWNQVDTVVTEDIVQNIYKKVSPKFNLILCPFQLLLEFAEYWPDECAFPEERYNRLISTTSAFSTEYLLPSSSGLKSANETLNSGLFPISIDQFKKDILEKNKNIFFLEYLPGKSFDISNNDLFEDTSSLVNCAATTAPTHEFNPTLFKETLNKNELRSAEDNKWETYIFSVLEENLKRCTHKMWRNILSNNLNVGLEVLENEYRSFFSICEKGHIRVSTHSSENDWDIKFKYYADDINKFLASSDFSLEFRGYKNTNLPILELMGFNEVELIDGWIGWNPIAADRLEKEYQLDV